MKKPSVAMALLLAGAQAVAQPRRPPSPSPSPPSTSPGAAVGTAPAVDLVPYRVRAGDTCASVALRMYRDARRTDLVHAYNRLGPPPHRLTPGQELRLPRRAPPLRGPLPDARLTAAHNQVEVFAPEERPGRENDPLFRGSRVSTQAQSSAEVTFTDETQLRLAEQTLVVILGDTSAQSRRVASARDTTLVTGSLRAYLGALAGRATAVPVNTPAARVMLGAGEAQVQVDAHHVTTLAVYRGRSQLRTRRRTVVVQAGFVASVEQGHDPTPPRPLPAAPAWSPTSASAPGVVFASVGGTADAAWGYTAGGDGAPPARWHVQLARDPRFDDPLTDAQVPAAVIRLEAHGLRPGGYVARVSAVDDRGAEGPWSPEVRLVVAAPRMVPTAAAHRASVELPAGTYCAVDDGALAPTGAAPVVDTLRPHPLRCALAAEGVAAETTLPRERLGPLTALVRVVEADPARGVGRLRLRLLDHAGEPVEERGVEVLAPAGVTAGAAERTPEPGVYAVPLRWQTAMPAVVLHVTVGGDEAVDTPPVALAFVTAAAPAPRPQPGFVHRWEIGLEAGAGTVLTGFQQNRDPGMFQGVTRGFGLALGGTARLGVRVAGPVAVQVTAASWVFPSDVASAGRAAGYMAGVRIAPRLGALGRLRADADAGMVLTGPYTRFGFDVGAGFEFALGRAVGLGPAVRYTHVVQPADDPFPYDAGFWTAGLSLSLRVPEPR